MSEKYDTLRVAYMRAKEEYSSAEKQLAIARAKFNAVEREITAEWRRMSNPEKMGSLVNVSHSPQGSAEHE